MKESMRWLAEDLRADAHWLIPMYIVVVALLWALAWVLR